MRHRLFLDSFREKESRAKTKKEYRLMGTLSGGNRQLIRNLRHAGILRDIDEKRFDPTRLIIVVCSDGQRVMEIAQHHISLAKKQTPGVPLDSYCIQTLALGGGGLLIADNSPVDDAALREDVVLLHNIRQAIALKNLDANGERPTIALYTHLPCGAAATAGLDAVEQIELLATAKIRLKNKLPKARILCCVHVHYPLDGREAAKDCTYYFSTKRLCAHLKDDYHRGIVHTTRCQYGMAAARA